MLTVNDVMNDEVRLRPSTEVQSCIKCSRCSIQCTKQSQSNSVADRACSKSINTQRATINPFLIPSTLALNSSVLALLLVSSTICYHFSLRLMEGHQSINFSTGQLTNVDLSPVTSTIIEISSLCSYLQMTNFFLRGNKNKCHNFNHLQCDFFSQVYPSNFFLN